MPAILEHAEIRDSVFPISVEDYSRLGQTGAVGHDVELIEGVILKKMSKSPLHYFLRARLQELLSKVLPEGHILRIEEPLSCSAISEPEPDLAIVKGELSDFRTIHPNSAKLVVEIAISSENRDRAKAAIYAANDVREYWILLPEKGEVVVMTDPDPPSETYRSVKSVTEGEVNSSEIPDFRLSLSEFN